MPYRVAAYADEISTDIQVQMDRLLDNGIKMCALRAAHGKGVLEWEEFQVPLTQTQFSNRGIKFSCLATPIGKAPVSASFDEEMERFRFACKRAKQMETKVIGIYSAGIPDGEDPAAHKDEAVKRVKALADQGKSEGVNLLIENDVGTFADNGDRFADLLSSAGAPNLAASFDFGSFVAAGEDPLQAWPKVKKWVRDFHIKDRTSDGHFTVAGKGEGHIGEVLKDALGAGWAGLLTVEPTLSNEDAYKEMDGKQCFKAAVDALKEVLKTTKG